MLKVIADHPRMRGVYLTFSPRLLRRLGSSPHARGLQGVTVWRSPNIMDHPRMRGVYPVVVRAPWN